MTERAMIFLIVAATLVAVTLIGGIVAIVRSISETTQSKANALSIAMLKALQEDEVEDA